MEEEIVACLPVSEEARLGIPYTPDPDFVIVECPHCGEKMWIGPKQMQKVRTEGVPMACVMCIVKMSDTIPTQIRMLDPNR